MAGAGYKLFNTGDVLLASEVNTYLMQQTVMSFADSAARTTALSGVLAEGMVSYLRDTNVVEIYNGSAWASLDDPNAIQNTIVDAKGDLITATGSDTPARLAVGNSGDILVADSSATTGLRWQGDYAAGKNKIINGDFRINQRNFTNNTANSSFNFDRWVQLNGGTTGTFTITPQTFTPGTAPVTGYEARNFIRCVTASGASTNTFAILAQLIEDVRTFANQTITVSFWAKAASGTPKVALELWQNFGSGGSSQVLTYAGQVTISTSWARYSITVNVPSISGKTLVDANSFLQISLWCSGGSDFNSRTGSIGLQNETFDFWGVQVEAGSTATSFQTATGTIQGELAACYRYFQRITDASGGVDGYIATSIAFGTTAAYGVMQFIAPFRSNPTTTLTSGNFEVLQGNGGINSLSSMTFVSPTTTTQLIGGTTTGLTSGQALLMRTGSTAFVLDISAEL
jgi:hypothetical protein